MKEVELIELTAPGCQHCAAFGEFWRAVEKDWPQVKFREVSVTTPEGQTLAGKHLIFASPGIILNGELFSTGGVNKEQFLEKLKALST
ncbi:MAG: thioredoxin family protein [Candidatus Vogelbacteria bacterium]|nr:thioredoxin family protein [Candidatus Vogelbacteria bacterium]